MGVHPIIPIGDKIERVRQHQALIRNGGIQLPADAVWRENFVAEWTLFPCAGFDDQVDAAVQYLDWILKNPAPPKRERSGLVGMNQFVRTADTTDGVYSGRAGQGRRVDARQWQALVLVAANALSR
jgi:hypothetical protein